MYDVRSQVFKIPVLTPSKGSCACLLVLPTHIACPLHSHSLAVADLQNVNITLRVLYRPEVEKLPELFKVCVVCVCVCVCVCVVAFFFNSANTHIYLYS